MDNNNQDLQVLLDEAIAKMEMQLARMLILEKSIKPKKVSQKDIMLFIRNAALLKDEHLLRPLVQQYELEGGKILLRMLDKIEAATALVRAGVKLNVTDFGIAAISATPLHLLLESTHPNRFELAILMIDRGAICVFAHSRHSFLQCAIKDDAPDNFIRKIISYSNYVDFEMNIIAMVDNPSSKKVMPLLVMAGFPDDQTRSQRARTAIKYLLDARTDQTEAIQTLFQYDMPVDARDDVGYTILHKIIMKSNLQVAELYLQRGANPNMLAGYKGYSPLWIASSMQDSAMSTLLIRYGADVHLANNNGQRPIHSACNGNSMSNVLLLIRLDVDINIVDRKGKTPLSLLYGNRPSNKNSLMAFFVRRLALVTFRNSAIKTYDIDVIRRSGYMAVFESCIQELTKMQIKEASDGIPYHTFLSGNVHRMSRFTRRNDFKNIFENVAKLKEMFPCYFCDLRNAYVFAKEREDLLMSKEQLLYDIVLQSYKISLPELVINNIVNYVCYYELRDFILNYHARTLPIMIWE